MSSGTGEVAGTVDAADLSLTLNCTTNEYAVGGVVSGLAEGNVVELTLEETSVELTNGAFTFEGQLFEDGTEYSLEVTAPPVTPSQTCTITDSDGTVAGANVSATVTCVTNRYAVGGLVTGLELLNAVTVTLGEEAVTITQPANAFEFESEITDEEAYSVTVTEDPTIPNQTCVFLSSDNSTAAGTVAGAAIDLTLECTTNQYSVGGTVVGLVETGLVLQNNGADDLGITENGPFTFATGISDADAYAVTLSGPTGPGGQTCAVISPTGTIGGADVIDVEVSCTVEQEDLLVLTSAAVAGDLGLLSDFDSACDTAAIGAGVGSLTFEALLYHEDREATDYDAWVLAPGRQYAVQSTADIIGTTNGDAIFDFPLGNAMAPGETYWTGFGSDWTGAGDCSGWSSDAETAAVGDGDATDDTALANGASACSGTLPVLCFERAASPKGTGPVAASPVSGTSVEVSFSEAVDDESAQNTLQYGIFWRVADETSIDTVGDAFANGTLGVDFGSYASSYTVTGLSNDAEHDVTVVVRDPDGNYAVYGTTTLETRASRFMFVTSSSVQGDFGGPGPGDTLCDGERPESAGIRGYKAMISDTSTRNTGTDWVLRASTVYRRLDGTYIGTTNGSATFGNATSPSFAFPNMSVGVDASSEYWTGLYIDWDTDHHCSDWSSTGGTGTAGAGSNNNLFTNLYKNGGSIRDSCSSSFKLVCVEQ